MVSASCFCCQLKPFLTGGHQPLTDETLELSCVCCSVLRDSSTFRFCCWGRRAPGVNRQSFLQRDLNHTKRPPGTFPKPERVFDETGDSVFHPKAQETWILSFHACFQDAAKLPYLKTAFCRQWAERKCSLGFKVLTIDCGGSYAPLLHPVPLRTLVPWQLALPSVSGYGCGVSSLCQPCAFCHQWLSEGSLSTHSKKPGIWRCWS